MENSAIFSMVVERGDPCVMRLVGELDLAGAPQVRARFADLDGDVDVDCSGLHFIDASGLGVLAAARTACDDRGAKLVLVDPSPFLRRLLQLTDLDAVFHVRATPSAS